MKVATDLTLDGPTVDEVEERPDAAGVSAVAWMPRVKVGLGEWVRVGRRFGVIGRSVGWWIGDWLRYGNARFGERYARAARITGYDAQTLMNMVYVASRIEQDARRPGLSWSHHAEVAPLEPDERERWLDLAESQRMSVRCLRDELRRARRAAEKGDDGSGHAHKLICPACGCRFNRAVAA